MSKLRRLRHQIFRLCVQFRDAGLAQVIAVGLVARLFDLTLAALAAELVERLPLARAATRPDDLRGTARPPIPFRAPLFALPGAVFPRAAIPACCASCSQDDFEFRLFLQQSRALLLKRRRRARCACAISLRQALLDRLRAGEPFGDGGELFAAGNHALLQALKIAARSS